MDSLQDLLKQYTNNIQYDPRVFSQDVMSQDTFSQPFNAWVDNFIDTNVQPEFNRYTYNPAIKNLNRSLYDANQNMGLSGAWRNQGAQSDMYDMADNAQLSKEGLLRDYGDMTMNIRDTFQSAWANPLYENQMKDFYNAPWRNTPAGAGPTYPQTTPDNKQYSTMPTPDNKQYSTMPINNAGTVGVPNSGADMGGNRNDLISMYLRKPSVSNQNSNNFLQYF